MIIRYITVRKSASTRHTAEMLLCRMIIYSNATCVLKGRNVTGWDLRATVSMRSLSCMSQPSIRIDVNRKTHWRLPRSVNWNPIETGEGMKDIDVGCTSRALFRPIAGNINEAIDIFANDVSLPGIQVGESLALLNAGGYGATMASNHCMRGSFAEYLLD